MSTALPPDSSPPIVSAAYELASYHVGKGLVDVLRNSSTGGKIRTGDYFLNRARPLIQQYYTVLPNEDQDLIHDRFQKVMGVKKSVDSASGFRKFFKAKEYEEVARYLFIIVETASRRVTDQNLMAQISEAIAGRDTQPPAFGTSSTHSDPFSDSHETSSLYDVDVGNLDQVEMSVFESSTTGEAAVVLGLHRRDGTTQEVASTFPLAGVPGGRRNEGVETATLSSLCTNGAFGPPEASGHVGQ